MVHRACPAGGPEQATATSLASAAPSRLRYCRPVGFFRWRAASSPPAANCWRTRMTVIRVVSRWSATSSSVQASGPAASAFSRIAARRRIAAGCDPVLRSRSRASRWSAVSRTTTFVAGAIADLLTGGQDSVGTPEFTCNELLVS